MARKTVSPQSLSPEQQRSLSVFLKSLQEYETLKNVPLPKTVLPTDFRCFMDGKIPRNALVCDEHWSWNQSNAKIRTVTDDGIEIIIQKLNPRKKPDTPLQRPSYKIWILAFRLLESESDSRLFVWCEKGINAALDHAMKAALSAPTSHVPFNIPSPLSPVTSPNPDDMIAEMMDMDGDSLMGDIDTILGDPEIFMHQLEGQEEGKEDVPVSFEAHAHLFPQPHAPVHHVHAGEADHAPSPQFIMLDSPKFRKRGRSFTYPYCTTKLAPLFQDPAWEEGDQVMMDYITAEEKPLCVATLTSSLGNNVVSIGDLEFLQQFGAPQPTCRLGDVHRQG